MISKSHTKYIQSLHHKKFRDVNKVFIAEGNKVVLELLQSGKFECIELFALTEWFQQNEPEIRKHYKGLLQDVAIFELEKITALSTPNQVLGIFKQKEIITNNKTNGIVLVLDNIQDPGNFGTIIRTADWFGVQQIICSNNCCEMYNPKVVQSTMGSLGRVGIRYTDLPDWLKQHQHIRVFAAALSGKSITSINKINDGIIIIGNESKGISEAVFELASEKITIPKLGDAESLNAAVATGIILSHLCG
jgi:TrmH family RNA methyltransferase